MANTTVSTQLQVTKFLSDFFEEYVRKSRFSRYTGTSSNNVIVIKEDKKWINIPLVTRLKGAGVTGSSTLRGNGESIGNYAQILKPSYKRHAVEFDKEELEKPAIDLMGAARPLLMNWAKEVTRDDIIQALGAVYNGTTYANYGVSTGAANDTWLTNNSDRILYGASKSNTSAGNHTTSLTNIDTTNDKTTTAMISLAKRMAKNADRHITPYMTDDDEEWFIAYADPYAFRDLKINMATSHQNAMPRSKDNPLFRDGDLVWDGVIIREVPEIAAMIDGTTAPWGDLATADRLDTGGDTSSRVGVIFLCGVQAIGWGLGQRPAIVIDKDYDYGFQPGVAVELKHKIEKLYFDDIQNGMVTMFVSAAVDA